MRSDILTNSDATQEVAYGIVDDADQQGSEGKYIYGNDIKTWIMPCPTSDGCSNCNYAPDESADPGKGLWRLRNKEFNSLYYDNTVYYAPWVGLDADDIEFADADPTDAPSNPYNGGTGYDLTATHSLGGGGGGAGGGSTSSSSSTSTSSSSSSSGGSSSGGLYLPYYWTWTDADSDDYVDIGEADTKIEILSGSTYEGGSDREDCVADGDAPNTCTYAEELQNFTNWYTYYRNRGLAAKGGLGAVLADHDDLRIGFSEFNGQSNVIGVDQLNESPTTGHKADVLETLYGTADSSGNNNMRTALQRTGNYFACSSAAKTGNSIVTPAGTGPGDVNCPILAAPVGNCQHNFALVVSAGFWGGTSPKEDADGDASSSFDGGKFASSIENTLADVAMYFYETDLQPSLVDEVPTAQRDLDGVPEANWSTAFGGSDGLVETMHQNMRTYVIGFGAQGDVDFDTMVDYDVETAFAWGDPTSDDTEKLNDLVHAALNGRGAYLDAGNPTELNTALEAAFNEFSTFVGTATAVASNAEEILVGSVIYRASYNVSDGSGQLIAQDISLNDDGLVELGDEAWSAAGELDSITYDNRVVITWDPENFQGVPFRYDNLNYEQVSELADAQTCDEADFDIDNCSAAFETEVTNHINWFRGDASNQRPVGNLRERPEVEGKIGDIVNSTPTFYGAPGRTRRNGLSYPQSTGYTYAEFSAANADREGIVYLAANDGMLHAFNGDTGVEEWAFIPNSAITGTYNNKIKGLLDFNYSHEYINDLSPAIEDVFVDTTGIGSAITRNWMTLLVGGLGAGGKGMYALDITDPAPDPSGLSEGSTAAINNMVLWEFTDEDDTYPTCERPSVDGCTLDEALVDGAGNQLIDTTITPTEPFRDLGFSLSLPTIAMSNLETSGEQEWVVMFGNGYNSSSGRAKLYVLRIEKGIDGEWCHADQVFDGNSDLGDTWAKDTANKVCSGGDDFVKIEASGPILTNDVNNNGAYDDGDEVSANGLGTPRGIDIDRNGTLDYAYAGDRFGNLYRFDLTSNDQTEWTAEVIFTAEYSEVTSGLDVNGDTDMLDVFTQPITTRPFAVTHPTASSGADCNPDPAPGAVISCGGFIIIFATGSYIYEEDGTSQEIQSIYGIWERFQSGADSLITKGDLVEQEYTFLDADQLFRQLSSNTVDYAIDADGNSPDRGYYLDFDTEAFSGDGSIPFAGEKAIRNIQAFAGAVFVNSVIPKEETSCTNEAGGAQNAFCPDTGGLECTGGAPIFDVNNDGVFDSDDLVSGTVPASLIITDGVPTDSTFIGRSRLTQLSDQSFQATLVNPATTDSTGRLSWKHLESTSD
jgi:type IV pilus assembly protein PilY1